MPRTSAKTVNTAGRRILKDTSVGSCARISQVARNTRQFNEQDSMRSFVRSESSRFSLAASAFTVKSTVEVLTGRNSSSTSTFHSTQLEVAVATRVVDLLQTDECLGDEANFDEKFLERFRALPLVDAELAGEVSSWAPYVSFLHDQGSHLMIQQEIGSRFIQWESSASSERDTASTLRAKACASVEGIGGPSGWSVEACLAYSDDEKRSALRTSSETYRLILGGTEATRAALARNLDNATLNAFVDAASDGDHAVAFVFKPIWEPLITFYSTRCASTGAAADCAGVQRAFNLQAAYEGWLAVGCPKLVTTNNLTYQQMVASKRVGQFQTYQCNVAKTGCNTDDDCHIGGAGEVCYCYGPSCIDAGPTLPGTSLVRSEVRGDERGHYYRGVNNACWYHAGVWCKCWENYPGGEPERQLYVQDGIAAEDLASLPWV